MARHYTNTVYHHSGITITNTISKCILSINPSWVLYLPCRLVATLVGFLAMKYVPHTLSQRWNTFHVYSASDEICSSYAQHTLNGDFELGFDFPYAEHAWKLVTRWLSMRENWLLEGWACAKIGYSKAEHARKLVTRWLSIRKNWLFVGWAVSMPKNSLLAGWAYAKLFSAHFQSFSSLSPVPHSYVPFSRPCLTSFVPPLTSLYFVSRPMSPVLRLCFLIPVLCLTYLFLAYRPLSPVLRLCSLYPIYPLSHNFAPCLPSSLPCLTWSVPYLPSSFLHPLLTPINCPNVPFSVALFYCYCPLQKLLLYFPSSVPPSLVLCPLFFILARMRVFLKNIHAYTCSRRFWWLATSWYCMSG